MHGERPGHGSPREIVEAFNRLWSAGRLDAALEMVDDDAVYLLHVSETTLPFGGENRGKANVARALAKMREDFEYVLYRPFPLTENGDVVRGQVEFIFRHRKTGETIDGRCRMIWKVANGRIVRCEEYQDAAKLGAFMRLVDGPP